MSAIGSIVEMDVHVTREDITKGTPGDAKACAIVWAIRREYGETNGVVWVSAKRDFIRIGYRDGLIDTYRTPKDARLFLADHDNIRRPRPFTFPLAAEAYKSTERRRLGERIKREQAYRTGFTARKLQAERGLTPKEARLTAEEQIMVAATPSPPRGNRSGASKASPKVTGTPETGSPVWDSNGVLVTPPRPKPRARVARQPQRNYNHRETISETYARLGVT
jgi:hypothetical protein